MIKIINGDLLEAKAEYICQQSNCISVKPHGLSKAIKDKFDIDPYSNRRCFYGKNYAVSEDHSKPGTIQVFKSKNGQKIICMFAQYGMGKPNSYGQNKINDSFEKRLEWFNQCLLEIAKLKPKSLAFPYRIGCGLAQGHWIMDYYPALKNFSKQNPDILIKLYKLE